MPTSAVITTSPARATTTATATFRTRAQNRRMASLLLCRPGQHEASDETGNDAADDPGRQRRVVHRPPQRQAGRPRRGRAGRRSTSSGRFTAGRSSGRRSPGRSTQAMARIPRGATSGTWRSPTTETRYAGEKPWASLVIVSRSGADGSPVTNTRLRPRDTSTSASWVSESSSPQRDAGEPVEVGDRLAVDVEIVGAVGEQQRRSGSPRPRRPAGSTRRSRRRARSRPRRSSPRRLSRMTTSSGRVVSTICLTIRSPVRAVLRQWMRRMSSPGTYSRSWWNEAVPSDRSRVGPSRSRRRPDGSIRSG